jgi:predicted deacylase
MFSICGLTVGEGEKKSGSMEVTKTFDGQALVMPFTVLHGAQDGPVLLLDGCIHGDEPEGPLAILRLIRQIDPKALRGTIVAIPAVNTAALASMKRGNPRDEHSYDLNRIYPGEPGQFLTGRLANRHFNEFLKKSNLEISVHGGGNHSFMCPAIFNSGIPESLELARAMGEDWGIVMTSLGDASPAGQGRKIGVAGITVEIGGTGGSVPELFDKSVNTLVKAFFNVLYHYGMLEGNPRYCSEWWFGHQETVYAEGDALIDPVYGNMLGKMLQPGDPVIRTINLFGETVQEVKAPCEGIPFGIHTYPSVTTGEWMLFFAAGKKVTDLMRA